MLNAGRGFNDAFEEQIGLQAESKWTIEAKVETRARLFCRALAFERKCEIHIREKTVFIGWWLINRLIWLID